MFLSCGSFSPSSFVSSDGLYQSQEVVSESNNGEFYKNYFKEKELELENNYELKWVQPIDQFLFSAHVELVAIFQLK